MAKTTLKTRIQNRHDTEANWTTASNATNPFIPLEGEVIVYDPDTTHTSPRVKIGDGTTKVGNLAFVGGDLSKYVTIDTAQTITGEKTFNEATYFENGISIGNSTVGDYLNLAVDNDTHTGVIDFASESGVGCTLTLPNGVGTIATLEDIPTNYVTTDTEQTISGKKTFNDSSFKITGGGNTWEINARTEEGPLNIVGQGAAGANTYQFPNKSGTIALTSDIPSVPSNILTYDYTFDTAGKNLSYPLMIAENPSPSTSMTRIDEGSITFRDLSRNNYEGTTQLVVAQVNNSDPVVVSLPSSSGELALKSDIPSTDNFVTLASAQNITGAKTFKSNLIVGTPSANSVTLSSNGIISNFQGIRGFDIDPSNFYIQARQYGAYQRLKFSTSLGVLAADTHTINVPVTNGTMLTTGNTKTIGGQSIEGSGDITIESGDKEYKVVLSDGIGGSVGSATFTLDTSVSNLQDKTITALWFCIKNVYSSDPSNQPQYSYSINITDLYNFRTSSGTQGAFSYSLQPSNVTNSPVVISRANNITTSYSNGTQNYSIPLKINFGSNPAYIVVQYGFIYKGNKFAGSEVY